MKPYRIEVMIVDDHVMFSEGLSEAINHSPVARVSRTFDTFEACRQALVERRPDVLLVDLAIPDNSTVMSVNPAKNGIAFCQEIMEKYPQLKVIVITIHDEYSVVKKMADMGVHGYVLKCAPVSQLTDAIQRVWRGERYLSPQASEILEQATHNTTVLTDIEKNILQLICDGYTNPEIADRLCISHETAKWYRKRLLAKYGAKNSVNLVTLVLKEKLL